jgi:PAS domain S-box-containing protein
VKLTDVTDLNVDFITDSIDEGIAISDESGSFIYVNDALSRMLRYDRSELTGKTPFDVTDPSFHHEIQEALADRASGESSNLYLDLVTKDGGFIPVRVNSIAHKSRSGQAELAVITDLSERREIEMELRERERQLTSMIDHVQGFFYRCRYDKHWTMIFLSRGCFDVTGYRPYEIINNRVTTFNEIIAREYRWSVRENWEKVFADKGVFEDEYPIITKDGNRRWIWERGWPVFDKDWKLVYLEGFIVDVTERRNTEMKLKESESNYRQLFESLHDAAVVLDRDFVVRQANPQAASYIGADGPDKLVGRRVLDFLSEPDRQIIIGKFDSLVVDQVIGNVEVTVNRPDGSQFPAIVSASMLRDSRGNPTGILAVIRDITVIKLAEQQEQENRKTQMLGRIAGGIAHYFNNMLGVITGYADMMRESTKSGSDEYRQLSSILEASSRSAELVRQILALSGRQAGRPVPITLSEYLTDNRREFQQILGRGVNLSLIISEESLCVRIDRQQLDTIFSHLLKNSRQAMGDQGDVTIGLRSHESCVRISIEDTGEGMSQELIKNVCEPFYTTRGEFTGAAGLGLSVVQGIIQQYHGKISISSTNGEGTRIDLYFPRQFDDGRACAATCEDIET